MRQPGLKGVIAVLVIAFIGGFVSFIWLPRAQLDKYPSLFDAFCAALGVPRARQATLLTSTTPRSDVVLTHNLLDNPKATDVGHGATLALRCTPCHGPTGLSYANSPNLAGQYAVAVYKQLRDYQSGVRTNAIMTPMAQSLSDSDMRRIAAYYASLAKPSIPQSAPPAIVRWGAPMRNIAPCGSCHGGIDHTLASPWLNGEPATYLSDQLHAFADGTRTNDINGQMRAMAHGLTPSEIAAAAAYYAGSP